MRCEAFDCVRAHRERSQDAFCSGADATAQRQQNMKVARRRPRVQRRPCSTAQHVKSLCFRVLSIAKREALRPAPARNASSR